MNSWILNANLTYNIFWSEDPLCNTYYIHVAFINKYFELMYVCFQIIVQSIPIIRWKQARHKINWRRTKINLIVLLSRSQIFLKKIFNGSKCQEILWRHLWMAPGLNSAKNNDAKIGNDFHKQAPLCWKPSPNFPELTSRLFPISSS